MAQYTIDGVDDRRVNEKTGALEYRVTWRCASPALYRTWEPRAALVDSASESLQAVDHAAMSLVDGDVAAWRVDRHWPSHPVQTESSSPRTQAARATASNAATEPTRGRKRQRPPPPSSRAAVARAVESGQAEVLSALVWCLPPDVVRSPSSTAAAGDADEGVGQGVAVLLGEVMLSDVAASALSQSGALVAAGPNGSGGAAGGRRRRPHTRAPASPTSLTQPLLAPALQLDGRWHLEFTHDLLHSASATRSMTRLNPRRTPLRGAPSPAACCSSDSSINSNTSGRGCDENARSEAVVNKPLFHLEASTPSRARRLEEERGAGALTVLGIAPPEHVRSGRVFAEPVSFVPWLGTAASEDLRRTTVAEDPHLGVAATQALESRREQLVVRYACPRALAPRQPASTRPSAEDRPAEVTTSMPLSVFRVAFPQLLIDYLLDHTVVLHGANVPGETSPKSSSQDGQNS